MELQKSNKISNPKFVSLSNIKNQQAILYPDVISNRTRVHYPSSRPDPKDLSTDNPSLNSYVEKYEPIRNYLAGKKLKGTKLTKIESLVLEDLNEKLDLLLDSGVTAFHKKSKDLIAEARRIILKSGLNLG